MSDALSDANLLVALIGDRGPDWHPCMIDVRPPLPHLGLTRPKLIWVPKIRAIHIDQVAQCVERDLKIPIQAQTLTYYHDKPSRMYGAHKSTCTCTCHGLRRTNLATDKVSKFMLKVDVSNIVNRNADACFRKWVQGGAPKQDIPSQKKTRTK